MKVAVDTYGCTRNKSDEELIRAQIKEHEKYKESNIEEADIVILNTCGVKNKTQSKMINRLKQYKKQGKKVLVAGCLPKISPNLLKDQEAAMTSPNTIEKIPKALKELEKGQIPIYTENKVKKKDRENKLKKPRKTRRGTTGIVPIAEGCLGNCSYCGVKKARGNLYSYPEKDIVKQVKKLLKEDKKQIYITSQDTGCYGKDREEKTDLPKLIQEITDINKEFKLRIGMMNPEHIKEPGKRQRLVKAVKNPEVYDFLHLPIQSGSNKVLKDMNRRYTTQEFKQITKHLKEEIKDLNLATDVIVGYPTEKEKHFQETVNLIKEVEPDVTNISRFHPRPGTKAAELEPHNSQILKKRSKKLSELTQEISKQKNQKYKNKEIEVLVTKKTEQKAIARAPNYKKIQIEQQKQKRQTKKGKAKVKITETNPRGLKGTVIDSAL